MYEVEISKQSKTKYNVRLINWQKNEGIVFGRSFNVSKKEAEKEAKLNAKLYNAKIIRKK